MLVQQNPNVTPQPQLVDDGEIIIDFETIIKDPELFLQIFSKEKNVIHRIGFFVDAIRQIFLKNYEEKKEFTIWFVHDRFNTTVMEPPNEVVDLTRQGPQIPGFRYEGYIKPIMQNLPRLLEINCTQSTVKQEFFDTRQDDDGNRYTMKTDAFKINCVYPIAPQPIANSELTAYSLYKQEILCDLTLVAKDGEIQVHALPFYLNGGEIIQTLLTTQLKEKTRKEILFSDASLETVKAFVDFIYLGEDGLEPETHVPLAFDLFVMAHTYNVKPLIDYCTNLISRHDSEKNIETIKYLAETYDNDHLKALYEHLSDDGRAKRIKV